MAEQEVSPAAIGSFMAIIFLPWALKLVSGPIMDRWSFLSMGRRRPWILAAQAGMFATSVALAILPDPLGHMAWLTALGFLLNFFTAFQDVAVDGMAIEIIPVDQQPRANGFMWGGKTIGIAVATASGAWAINAYGLGFAWFVHAVFVGLIMVIPLALRERPGERLLPWSPGRASEEAKRSQLAGWRDIGLSLFKVFLLPGNLTIALAGFITLLAHGMFLALMPVVTVQQLGWTDVQFSDLSATAGLASGIIGMAAGGLLAEKLGPWRAVAYSSLLLAVVSIAMGLSPTMWDHRLTIQVYIFALLVLNTLIAIAFFASLMRICWARVAATQFALYLAIANLGLSAGPALLGPVQQRFGYPAVFFALGCCAATVFVLIQIVDTRRLRQRVIELG